LGYLITFIANFILAYFIYDETGYVRPLTQSVLITAVVVITDLIRKNKKKRNEYSKKGV